MFGAQRSGLGGAVLYAGSEKLECIREGSQVSDGVKPRSYDEEKRTHGGLISFFKWLGFLEEGKSSSELQS